MFNGGNLLYDSTLGQKEITWICLWVSYHLPKGASIAPFYDPY